MVVDGWERGMVWVLSRAPSVCLGCLAGWCVRVLFPDKDGKYDENATCEIIWDRCP